MGWMTKKRSANSGEKRVTPLMEIVWSDEQEKNNTHQESKLTQEKHWWRCEQTNLRKSTNDTHVSIIRGKNRHHDHWTEILLRENLQPTTPAAGGLLSSMKRLCWAGLSIGPMRHLNEALLVEVSVAILMQHFLQIVTPKVMMNWSRWNPLLKWSKMTGTD